jgi:ABC-type Zn uptake system ZnuABC Zn-binding protein ZnuA
MQRLLSWLAAAALVLVVSACGSAAPGATEALGQQTPTLGLTQLKPVPLGDGDRLRVIATTNILGDVVGNVGGDRIELTTLMGVGIDPHSYVPTPADTAAIHDAHLVLANGAGLEANLAEMFDNAGGQAIKIQVSDGLQLRKPEAGHSDGEEEGEFDPHVWFDVNNTIRWVDVIAQALGALDPANAQVYEANAQVYRQQLDALDTWIVDQVATIPEANRKLVTNHPAFGYFAGRYGVEQLGAVYPISPSSEPSAQDVAALEDEIRKYGVPAVFTESTVNPRLAEQVARDTGVQLITLYTGSLGGPGSGAESYIQLMRFDVSTIVQALR